MTRPVAQLSDKSRVNSSSYRNEALASHGGSQVLNVAPQTERNPGHSGAMADASKAADAVDATGSLSVGALAVPDSGRPEACSICEAPGESAKKALSAFLSPLRCGIKPGAAVLLRERSTANFYFPPTHPEGTVQQPSGCLPLSGSRQDSTWQTNAGRIERRNRRASYQFG